MCGITGYVRKNNSTLDLSRALREAVASLIHRGPDYQGLYEDETTGLGHTRLSILDTSEKANQPMMDPTGRYVLIFNGEIFNHKKLANNVHSQLVSNSDTEVLLHLLIKEGAECIKKLNGFFAFAFYDKKKNQLLLARDKMGIKPLYFYQNEQMIVFGSELKSLLCYPIPRLLNKASLLKYLTLTYLPFEQSMIQGVSQLRPGEIIEIKQSKIYSNFYFQLNPSPQYSNNFASAKDELVHLLNKSVEKRMVADVPLGAFLSGGIDSSVIVSIASKYNPQLHTYSIGYQDHPYFDETHYAELVADRFKTNHTTFSLTNEDMLSSLESILNYLDEPFADSSAIPTYILSKKVSETMKVALSGDGADELFGGYYKYLAFEKATRGNLRLIKFLHPLIRKIPHSRSTPAGNLIRRMNKLGELTRMSASQKYWRLASFYPNAGALMNEPNEYFDAFGTSSSTINLNTFLDADLSMVLPGDMLTKVDRMSMANGLEVRVPFLDPKVVAFARSLPSHFKIRRYQRKRILQEAYAHILPKALRHRPKKGFEVPLLHWLKNELFSEIEANVFNRELLESQNIFNAKEVIKLKSVLLSKNPEDVQSIIWAIYAFQKWHNKYL